MRKAGGSGLTLRPWTAVDAEGRARITRDAIGFGTDEAATGEIECFVRSPGFAPSILRATLPAEGPIEVALSAGRRV